MDLGRQKLGFLTWCANPCINTKGLFSISVFWKNFPHFFTFTNTSAKHCNSWKIFGSYSISYLFFDLILYNVWMKFVCLVFTVLMSTYHPVILPKVCLVFTVYLKSWPFIPKWSDILFKKTCSNCCKIFKVCLTISGRYASKG